MVKGLNKDAKLLTKKNMLSSNKWILGRAHDNRYTPVSLIKNGESFTITPHTSDSTMISQYVEVTPNTTYVVSFNVTDAASVYYVYNDNNTNLVGPRNSGVSFNSGNNKRVLIGIFKTIAGGNPYTLSDLQMELGGTQTSYEPYKSLNKTPKPNKVLKTITADFKGKVAGSVKENPHVSKRGEYISLIAPTSFGLEDSYAVDNIQALDGRTAGKSTIISGNMAQHLFSFNIIEMIERQFGDKLWKLNDTLANKVAIAKSVIKNMVCEWHGFGSSPTGNKANLKRWANNSLSWFGSASNTASSVSRLALGTGNTSEITPEGIMHYIAYAEPSNGTVASVINTDYVTLTITVEVEERHKEPKLVVGKNLVPSKYDMWEVGTIAVSDGALVGLTTRIRTKDFVPAQSGKTYFFTSDNGHYLFVYAYNNGKFLSSPMSWRNGEFSFVAPQGTTHFKFSLKVDETTNINPIEIEKAIVQIEEGMQTPFEPYRLANKSRVGIPKAAKMKYNFDFKRESIEILDGVQYGLNQPRLTKNGGLVIEEGTVNLTSLTKGEVINSVPKDIPTASGWKDITGSFPAGSTFVYSGMFAIQPNDTSTNDRVTLQIKYTDGTSTTFSSGLNSQIRDGKYRYIEVKGTATTGKTIDKISIVPFDYSNLNMVNRSMYDVQLEMKPYATSFVEGERKVESLKISKDYLDDVKGSASLSFKTGNNFLNRDSNLPIFECERSSDGIRAFMGTNGTKVIFQVATLNTVQVNFAWQTNTRYSLSLTWDETTFYGYIDDKLIFTAPRTIPFVKSDIFLGSDNKRQRQSGLAFYSFTLKDRNGNITFEL